MNQFTSHIDFSLTIKRFKMMSREFSPFKSYSKSIFLIPFFGILAFAFCTDSNPHDLLIYNNNEDLPNYTDVTLGYKLPADSSTNGELLYYTLDGKLYTGTVNSYDRETDRLLSRYLFKDGLQVGGIQFDKNGNQSFRVEHFFENGLRAGFRQFGENDQIIRDWVGTPEPDDSLSTFREWHPNGQLKFEMYADEDMNYEKLMTLYDEQGNIIQQELYEDGELIEKIK